MTIFQWLSLSLGLEPILENMSDPLQHSSAIRESTNHMYVSLLFYCTFFSLGQREKGAEKEKPKKDTGDHYASSILS